jgi:hypothetical protein
VADQDNRPQTERIVFRVLCGLLLFGYVPLYAWIGIVACSSSWPDKVRLPQAGETIEHVIREFGPPLEGADAGPEAIRGLRFPVEMGVLFVEVEDGLVVRSELWTR